MVFAALPHGLSQELAKTCDEHGKAFIDLGADFRLDSEEEYQEWYGGILRIKPSMKRRSTACRSCSGKDILGKKVIANPGCYTTGALWRWLQRWKTGLIELAGIIIDSKSGVTGAGRGLSQGTHYPDLNEALTLIRWPATGIPPEMEQTLSRLSGQSRKRHVRAPLPAGEPGTCTCYARLQPGVTKEQVRKAARSFIRRIFSACCRTANADIQASIPTSAIYPSHRRPVRQPDRHFRHR